MQSLKWLHHDITLQWFSCEDLILLKAQDKQELTVICWHCPSVNKDVSDDEPEMDKSDNKHYIHEEMHYVVLWKLVTHNATFFFISGPIIYIVHPPPNIVALLLVDYNFPTQGREYNTQ